MAHDPLSDLSMKPSRDDLARRQTKGKPASKASRPSGAASDSAPRGKGSNGPIWLVLLLVVAGAGAGGWFMWQEVNSLSAELTQSKQMLTESQSNLGDLKQNIASQSSTIDQTGDQIRKDLDFHMSEIRKLWDLANKTNRPAITANEKAIAQLKTGIAEQKTRIAQQEQMIANAEAAASRSSETAKGLVSRVKQGELQTTVLNTQLSELEAQLAELVAQNKALKNMLTSQEAAIKRLEADGGKALQAKLADLEQRLNSVDAFRQQVNTRLTQHDRSITELYQKP